MGQRGEPTDDDVAQCGRDVDEVLSRANPNPERVGCLTHATLVELVMRAKPLGDPGYAHLLTCSPCYRRFQSLQQQSEKP